MVKILDVGVLICAVAWVGLASAGNLLTNGSFDQGTAGWTRLPSSWPACTRDAGTSLGWVGVSLACGDPPVAAAWRQAVPVIPGRHYRVGARVMAAALSADGDVTLVFRGGGGVIWQTGVEELAGTTAWRTMTWEVQAPPGATEVDVVLGVDHGTDGTVGFDDVTLEESTDTGPRQLAVDLEQVVGTIRNLNQTNKGPVVATHHGGLVDFSERLHTAGITMIRQHDVHIAFDMHVIFPDPDADPTLEASYRFETTDEMLREAADRGFSVMFRLGESYGEAKSPRMSAQRWAEVVRHVVAHVNGGWADGGHAGVPYWEIWNEANGPLFWSGTPQEFYELYALGARAVKAADPSTKVGGPGMAGHTAESWLRGLLRYARASAAPVDFVSWHIYHMGNPHTLALAQRQIRALVDEEGFPGAEVLLTEWNLNGGSSCERMGCGAYVDTAYNAAHAAAAISYLQDTDLPLAFRYRTDGTGLFGLFGDGAIEPAWSPSGLAFGLLAQVYSTPRRVATEGGDESGFTMLGGCSADGASCHVLIADQASPATAYRLELRHAPVRFTWSVEEVADRHGCTPAACQAVTIAQGTEDDLVAGALEVPIAAPAVHLVHLDASPGPDPRVRRRLGRAQVSGSR